MSPGLGVESTQADGCVYRVLYIRVHMVKK